MTDGPEPDLDAVFKALNDPTRRAILDALRARDGQSLTEIESDRALSRFGVMKHLKVLEDAGLVIPRRSGRFKHHFLNAVPLQQVIDRWIDPFVQKPLARLSLDLKTPATGRSVGAKPTRRPGRWPRFP
jgi:DNA-binding transcriptional ArsR family regulator